MKFYLIFFLFLFKSTALYGEVIKLNCNPKIIGSNDEIEWKFFRVQVDTKLNKLDYKEKRPGKEPKIFKNIVSSIDNKYVYFINAVDPKTKLRFDYINFIQSRLSNGLFVDDWDFRCIKDNM
jgi:hypothetical protein